MASTLNLEAGENQNQQAAEEFIADVGKYNAEELRELIEEALLFSSSLSIALQAVEDPCVNEIQTSIVIDKLRITLAGAQEWVKNNGGTDGKKPKSSASSNDEL